VIPHLRCSIRAAVATLAWLAGLAGQAAAVAAERPNIVILYADDLGWDWPLAEGDRPRLTRGRKGRELDGPADVSDADRATWRRIFSKPIGGGPIG